MNQTIDLAGAALSLDDLDSAIGRGGEEPVVVQTSPFLARVICGLVPDHSSDAREFRAGVPAPGPHPGSGGFSLVWNYDWAMTPRIEVTRGGETSCVVNGASTRATDYKHLGLA
jgi:hypothetical protein